MDSAAALKTSTKDARFAEVALPIPVRHTFHYVIPEAMKGTIETGARVLVPFGKRRMTGYVVDLSNELDKEIASKGFRLRKLLEVPDERPLVTEEILQLTKWTAEYYSGSWGELLKASLPAGLSGSLAVYVSATPRGRSHPEESGKVDSIESQVLAHLIRNGETPVNDLKGSYGSRTTARAISKLIQKKLAEKTHRRKNPELKPKTVRAVRLKAAGPETDLSRAQEKVIVALKNLGGEASFQDLLRNASVSASPVKTLQKAGLLEIFEKELKRDPLADGQAFPLEDFVLTNAQESTLGRITEAIEKNEFKAFLLHGVTGSGKTEVYIRAVRKALAAGKSALMLVPEIALTPVFSQRLRSVFGGDVAILHSSLSKGERFDEWRRIREGEARVAIGTRSAVFAPLKDLGLIVVDEEHDSSYRQHEMPFYHARDVALVRARSAGAVAVLGTATPALESFFNANAGKYELLSLPGRINDRPLARAEVIDLRESIKEAGEVPVLSKELKEAISEVHARGEQSMILLNRRGFSQFVLCRSCGETIRCINCDISLTYHQGIDKLVCHYCNYRIRTPTACPKCESQFLYFLKEGTEQLEKVLRKEFPDLKIARLDRDTTRKRKQLEKLLKDFSDGKIDMLTGTQMLAKGHDFPNVTLVGVVSVDTGLALPDFRSAERTFQLLTQVAGRAGRGDRPGRVLIQTFYPDHYAIKYAREQDYEAFFQHELKYRRRLGYPPFTAVASILVKHAEIQTAAKHAGIVRAAFPKADPERICSALGPAPAALGRLKGEYRLQLLARSPSKKRLRETVERALEIASKNGCDLRLVTVEIDPVNLL
ncbi:MAG: primosomal protein N' [Acidobacteria bacterium]|nr:MAG: primosomal protein N' [Acidobacteriota bacterium]REK02287.1 MAG: primosomal protein N' [Acidobacteriota bacterium]REK13910.1 MAG: primosomal protein N' [Acidobacteriota bacterium]REK41904.1 MAG: primosomal protein N' [Acidobacteriota bacterium]